LQADEPAKVESLEQLKDDLTDALQDYKKTYASSHIERVKDLSSQIEAIEQPKPKPRGANLTKMARAGIMILGWFFARELLNAAGQGKVREFLSQGLKIAWAFDTLTDADFVRFFAACVDDTKAQKVYALYCEITVCPVTLDELRRLSAPIEYRSDYGIIPPPHNRHETRHAAH
jgi:hypothetical protein